MLQVLMARHRQRTPHLVPSLLRIVVEEVQMETTLQLVEVEVEVEDLLR